MFNRNTATSIKDEIQGATCVSEWEIPFVFGKTPGSHVLSLFEFSPLMEYITLTCGLISDLIDANTKDWNHLCVRELFWQDEADVILTIPLSSNGGEDLFIWHHTANGEFSVGSAYHVAVSLSSQSQPSTSTSCSPIWKTNIPRKIRFSHGN